MRILISRVSPGVIGGAELSAYDQAVVLKELGHQVAFATSSKQLRQRAKGDGIKTYSIPWVNHPNIILKIFSMIFGIPIIGIKMLWIIFRFKPDIINTHSREDQIPTTFLKPIHRRPVIWKDAGDIRAQVDPILNAPKLKRVYTLLFQAAIRRADHIYMLTQEDIDNLHAIVKNLDETKFSAVPSSILYRYYDLKAQPLEKNQKLIIGFLGRVIELKGIFTLMRAIKLVGHQDKVEFWIVGDGEHGDLEKAKDLLGNDQNNVKFFPHSYSVSSFYNSFDIYLQPSFYEGWGRTVKEAMYFSLPIIGAKAGGVAKQIEDGQTGLLFKVDDHKDLAVKITKLIEDKTLRKTLAKNGHQKAMADGDFKDVVEKQILPIYEKFLTN